MQPCNLVRGRAVDVSMLAVLSFVLLAISPLGLAQRHGKETKPAVTPAATPASSDSAKPAEPKKWDDALKGLKYRNIGPFRGGRSLTAAGIPGDPNLYYFGSDRKSVV